MCCVLRRTNADEEPAVGKTFRRLSHEVGMNTYLWAQYWDRSSIGRCSSAAATVAAISLVYSCSSVGGPSKEIQQPGKKADGTDVK